jgi:hypothetical protein
MKSTTGRGAVQVGVVKHAGGKEAVGGGLGVHIGKVFGQQVGHEQAFEGGVLGVQGLVAALQQLGHQVAQQAGLAGQAGGQLVRRAQHGADFGAEAADECVPVALGAGAGLDGFGVQAAQRYFHALVWADQPDKVQVVGDQEVGQGLLNGADSGLPRAG